MRVLILKDINNKPSNLVINSFFDEEDYEVTIMTIGELINNLTITGLQLHDYLYKNKCVLEATSTLSDLIKGYDILVGFSAGGYLIWKAQEHFNAPVKIICISPTRLRSEHLNSNKNNRITFIYGSDDKYKPNEIIVNGLSRNSNFIVGEGHNSYESIESKMNESVKELIKNEYISNKNIVQASYEYSLANYDRSISLYKKELKKSQFLEEFLKSAEIYEMLASIYSKNRLFDLAKNMYENSICFYKKCNSYQQYKIPILEEKISKILRVF